MIKNLLLGATTLVVLTGTAVAADLRVPAKAPEYIAPWAWSGIYVGIHGGWEWSAFDPGFGSNSNELMAILGNPGVLGANANGGFVGGHIGLNLQQGQLVFGPRFDIDLSGLQGSMTNTSTVEGMSLSTVVTHSIPWHGDFVGKLGYLITPQTQFYGVGGLAFGEIKDAATVPNLFGCSTTSVTCGLSDSNVHVGWMAGLGIEHAITPNILVGLEWDYTNLGHHGVTLVGPGTAPITFNVDDKAAWNSVKGMLTFKF